MSAAQQGQEPTPDTTTTPGAEAPQEQPSALALAAKPGQNLPARRPEHAPEKPWYDPTSFEEAYRFATAIARSALAPKEYSGKPDNVFVAMLLGAQLGLPPMASVQNIAVINGRPSTYGDVVLGICMASPQFAGLDEHFEGEWPKDDYRAVCTIQRVLPNGALVKKTWEFSLEDAKRGKLWGKEGPWSTSPRRMLQMRARGFSCRDVFPDLLKGIISREEAIDIDLEPQADGSFAAAANPQALAAAPSLAEQAQKAREKLAEMKTQIPAAMGARGGEPTEAEKAQKAKLQQQAKEILAREAAEKLAGNSPRSPQDAPEAQTPAEEAAGQAAGAGGLTEAEKRAIVEGERAAAAAEARRKSESTPPQGGQGTLV